MRLIILTVGCLLAVCKGYNQNDQRNEWVKLVKSSDSHLKPIMANKNGTSALPVESIMQTVIQQADGTYSLSELTRIVNICSQYCSTSPEISSLLINWLRENDPIYDNRSPIEANQFHSFLLASMAHFPASDEVYRYVKSELLFADHSINVAAAAAIAKNFRNKAAELIPLMEPFLSSSFPDEWVDITTPELNYPIAHPTKARYEIIQTLAAYGSSAYRSVTFLNRIIACNGCADYGRDSTLYKLALTAADHIRKVTPECCRKDDNIALNLATQPSSGLVLIDKQDRNSIPLKNIQLLDQEGDSLKFQNLTGQPFVLTFFYTQCTNASKCVSTVHRLGQLEEECIKSDIASSIGIYGFTYDPDFDSPSILKKYGEMYGVKFNKETKFLKTVNDIEDAMLTDQLHLRVNYGAGTVNQHGIQLYIFDKEGKLAAICDNDSWSVLEVKNCLNNLINE